MDNLVSDSIQTIRTLSIDAVQKANSGHPGAPMGLAPAAYTLWKRHLNHNPSNPSWFNRDRFILSNGHASMLLYSLLHLTGYPEMTIEEIKNFRQWGSQTPGHPEFGHTKGVETTTGPLGQGLSTAVGFALAEAILNAKYGDVVDHYTYGICGDGDLMEGITSEASSLAGHLKLGKLIFLYDDNKITIDGTTDIAFTEDVLKRYEAYGWHTDRVEDGNDVEAIDNAIDRAKKITDKPSLISVRTIIGYGSPKKENSPSSHGAPLGVDEVIATKKAYGWDHPDFYVSEDVRKHMDANEHGTKLEKEWQKKLDQLKEKDKTLYDEFLRRVKGELPENLFENIDNFSPDEKGLATRASSGKILTKLMHLQPELVGGSADLAGSNVTLNKELGIIEPGKFDAQNIHFGVREHAMGAICNGLALHGGFIPFNATFLIFSEYMKPALRLASLSNLQTFSILTHDSIGLGEDGPTHQPIEQIPSLRATPNFALYRPADANEVIACWKSALENKKRPAGFALTRQALPTIDKTKYRQIGDASQGAYVISEPSNKPVAILLATGSEVDLCLKAAAKLSEEKIDVRVVSMPCWEVFEEQDQTYKEKILPPELKIRMSVEAASTFGWEKYVGFSGKTLGMTTFGASAPAKVLFEKFGFTVNNIVNELKVLIKEKN